LIKKPVKSVLICVLTQETQSEEPYAC
jgi:hypothetical protein